LSGIPASLDVLVVGFGSCVEQRLNAVDVVEGDGVKQRTALASVSVVRVCTTPQEHFDAPDVAL